MADSGDLAQGLLNLARDDATALAVLLREDVANTIVGFHAQQAVEKALKAALAAHRVDFPYTHDIDGLIELCRSSGLELPDALAGVENLSPFGVVFRYGVLERASLDRSQAARWAELAIDWAAQTVEQGA